MGINVFSYRDHLSLLRALLEKRSGADRRFSHRHVVRTVGFRSPSMLRKILSGRYQLTPKVVTGLRELFELNSRECAYLTALVEMNQATDIARREALGGRLSRMRLGRVERVPVSRYGLYSAWHHTAIWALLACRAFDGDFGTLGAALTPPVSPTMARKSVALLKRLGMIREDSRGHLRPASPLISTGPTPALAMRRYHLDAMRLAARAMDCFPQGVREMSTVTVALSGPSLKRAREHLAECRRRILAETAQAPRTDRVYQFNFQAFPMALPGSTKRGQQ